MKHTYSDDELIRRVWDVEEIKKAVNKRVYYIANEWRQKEIEDLWVREEEHKKTASFGRNTGYYLGLDEVVKYYVQKHTDDCKKSLQMISEVNPDIANIPDNMYIGCLSNHPVSTGLVELAGDGETAKGLWYCISQDTTPNADGSAVALWKMEKLAIDFIKEQDAWKIWHVVIATDLSIEAGCDYSQQSVYMDYEKDPVTVEFGIPTIQKLIHDSTFNWWDNYPPMPIPYETFSDEISYGPEGYKKPENKGFDAGEGRNYQ